MKKFTLLIEVNRKKDAPKPTEEGYWAKEQSQIPYSGKNVSHKQEFF